MKPGHTLLYILLLVVLFSSCSAPYQVSTNVKLKYDWVLSNVTVDGDLTGTTITSPVFEDVPMQCLQGSKWSFFDEGSGNYTIADNGDCLKGVRKITWEVVTLKGKSHYMQFYRYNAPKGILTDRFTLYIAEITDLSKSTMVLKYPVNYHGKTGNIVMTFTRQ